MAVRYVATSTEKVQKLNEELSKELSELKAEVEENEMVHGIYRTISSVAMPKTADYFKQGRQLLIDKTLKVNSARPLIIQADAMREELDIAQHSDYTVEGLPLLLHQFFCDRIHQLVQCKHMHMLRWRRFSEHISTIEALYPDYQKRLAYIMSEYNDCIERAQRLSVGRESFLARTSGAAMALKMEDLYIYLRWLICHLHSVKKFNQFFRVLEWLPVSHGSEISAIPKESCEDDESTSARIPSKYNEEMASSRRGSTMSVQSLATCNLYPPPLPPPPVTPGSLTSSTLPAAQFAVAAAAAGGGVASDEENLGLPLHYNDLEYLRPQLKFLVNLYNIPVDVDKIASSADEMELYAAVNRKFKQQYTRQEHLKTFKTYDRLEVGQENWGADTSMHALLQESNWLSYVTLKPTRDPSVEKKLVEMKTKNNIDSLLKAQSCFIQVPEPEKVQEALRQHASVIRDPLPIQAMGVASHRTNRHSSDIWKRIYTNPELYNRSQDKDDMNIEDFDERDADKVNFSRRQSRASSARRKESYDYFDAVQLLGLDDGEQSGTDPSSLQAAFVSFLLLRHLRIRDLQRTCLSILNFFRSVERTLTINDGGLSQESSRIKRSNPQDHRKSVIDASIGAGGGIGSHQYIYNTPKDFKINESEFMEFSEVENHDDFYVNEEGRVHVQDQRGYYIVYDAAVSDLKDLEQDLLFIATHYIEKDSDLRSKTGINRSESASSRRRESQTAGDFDIASYGHQGVDRFGVLLDLWTHHASFLESKKELFDCYLEAYQHTFDRDEKRLLAQVLTNIMYQKPKLDFEAPYFIRSYRWETISLRLHSRLVKAILDAQIEEEREHLQKVCGEEKSNMEFGLPHSIVQKQPIAINGSKSALKNVYMLEFHPSLAAISRLPECLDHAYWEIHHKYHPETVTQMLLLKKRVLETAFEQWTKMDDIGSSFSAQVQKDVFSDVYVEQPSFMCDLASTAVHQQEQASTRKSQKDKQEAAVACLGRFMEIITTRYKLIDAAWETEVLSKIYKRQAVELGYDECHLFLRFVQFEYANHKEDAGKPPPVFITAVQEDDSVVDRMNPSSLYLAIHELDEGHVGKLSFRNRDGLLQLLKPGGLPSLMTVLKCQLVHKNMLMSAVQQAAACIQASFTDYPKSRSASPVNETKSEKSSLTFMTGISSGTGATGLTSRMQSSSHKANKAADSFVSLQLEKTPSRDLMLNEFVNKKSQMGTILRNPEEMEKLKRKLLDEYCDTLNTRMTQYSLRGQLLAYYNSILGLLRRFPSIRETYFMFGEASEKKTPDDDVAGLEPDPRAFKKRPRRILSPDGQHVLNIWFIPHYSEILIMFKTMDDARCMKALYHCVCIVSALHDILQYLCAHSNLGTSQVRMGSHRTEQVSADWGGAEGIGTELRSIQKQIDNLDNPKDPREVARLLALRRDVMFLEFDTAVRHSMKDLFLSSGNIPSYKAITECMHFALHELSNAQHPSVFSCYMNVPEPLEPSEIKAKELFPWRSYLLRDGPFPIHFWQWQQIDYYMQLCMAGLKEVDRQSCHGEILGVSLLMEDVLMSGQQDRALTAAHDHSDREDPSSKDSKGSTSNLSVASLHTIPGQDKQVLSIIRQPVQAYMLLKSFLLLWKQLELLKQDWGKRKLGVQEINKVTLYRAFCTEYKKEMLYPVLQSVARKYGQAELYEGIISDSQALVMPKGASEMEIRTKQVLKLLENLECHMIMEVRKRLSKELNLVLAERAREEGALPTDLWKKAQMKESVTIAKPQIVENFTQQLLSKCEHGEEADGEMRISKTHLNECLWQLASDVMARERSNYESYSMYYENLLRVHHQLLYQREQELKQVQSQLAAARASTTVEVQCQLADHSGDLLMEITALRAKITEMREKMMTQERDIEDRIRDKYDKLIKNLFSSAFELKAKFDEFRGDLHDDVYEKIGETRRDTMEMITKLRQRSGISIADEGFTQKNVEHSEKMRDIQHENHTLNTLMIKMKTLHNWKQTQSNIKTTRGITEIKKNLERSQKRCQEVSMMAEQEVVQLRQQVVALRTALRDSQVECDSIRRQLDAELRDKKEKSHEAKQRALSCKQLEDAKRGNMEKLLDELEEKEDLVRQLSDEQDKMRRIQQLSMDKARRDVSNIKKRLAHERSLKLEGFKRVDELQTQVYDIETSLFSRPQTAHDGPAVTASGKKPRSRASSAVGPGRSISRATVSSGNWPPATIWPANRSLTPAPEPPNHESKKIQRPKTPKHANKSPEAMSIYKTVGRLRSRIAEQLVHELDPPDHYETLIRLQEMQQQQQVAGQS